METTTNYSFKLERGSFAWNVVTPTGVRYFKQREIAEDCIRFLEEKQKKKSLKKWYRLLIGFVNAIELLTNFESEQEEGKMVFIFIKKIEDEK